MIFALLRVTPCVADGAFLFTASFSSASVNTSATGVALLSRAKVLMESARPSTGPVAKTRPGAAAAHTLVTRVGGSNVESPSGGPGVRVRPVRTMSPAAYGRPVVRPALRVVPMNPSTLSVPSGTAPVEVMKTPHRPAAGSRMLTLFAGTTQPKISALLPVGPQP